MIKDDEKITREVNEILIDRIRKYQTQDITQLINSPNDEDTNNSYLGGLINFVGDNTENLDDEINNDLDKITINEIFIEPQPDNEYISEITEEEEEEIGDQQIKKVNQENTIKIEKKFNKIIEEKNSENSLKKENSFINPFIMKSNNPEGIRVLLTENFNNYLDLIGVNYEKFDNNHFPKVIVNDKNNTKKIILNNLRSKIYYTKEGEKIIINDEVYNTSLAYLKNKEIYQNIPARFKKTNKEFTLDFNLLDETIENIQMKMFEFIEINKEVSTSISKITLYCIQLNKYVKDKLEPFNNSINISYGKLNSKKKIISEIKKRTLINSGELILKKIKMTNLIKLLDKLKKYQNIKLIMNNLEKIISDPKNYQKTFELINKCKNEIDIIKKNSYLQKKVNLELKENKKNYEKKLTREAKERLKKEKNNEVEKLDPIIDVFENRLNEYKNENETHMSREFSQVLNNYFNNFLIIENENEINFDKKEKMAEYEKYNFSKFVLDKVSTFSNKHYSMLASLYFPSPKVELEKMDVICDYYIESNLISKIYNQLKGIYVKLTEQVMNNILSLVNELININNENELAGDMDQNQILSQENAQNRKKENKGNKNNVEENEKGNELKDNGENNDNNQICLLLCILLSKNKFDEIIMFFIDILLQKIEKDDKIEKSIKLIILKEIQQIKIEVKNTIKRILLQQIQKCLHIISSCNNIDLYINNFYLTLEMLKNEISYFTIEKSVINEENNDDNNNANENNNEENNIENNDLASLIIEEQKFFIDNWLKYHLSKLDSEIYKSWESLKDIPPRYQNILNVFLNFDINNNCLKDEFIITKFPSEQIKLIKDAEDEEDENTNNNSLSDTKENLLFIKDGEKPEIKIKITQTSLEIIKFSFELLKMFSIFHKVCYGFILESFRKLIYDNLEFQIDQIYGGKCGFSVSQQEISMTYGIFVLIQYIYEHIKNSEFFVTVAENSDQNVFDKYLDLSKNINDCCNLSKSKIEDFIDNHCINETLNKLKEIKLPYYNVISGDVPVNEYALYYVSSLKDIYDSMINCFEDTFMKEMIQKSLDDFFEQFEKYILHGKKIEDENCLKQFKRDMIFLKKNLVFINIIDLTELRNRIENINKSVLPEWLRLKKK